MSKAIDIAIKSAEKQSEREMNSRLAARMSENMKDKDNADSFHNTILALVANENYIRAAEEIQTYVESKSEFPQFKERASRYVNYANDLMNAIKAKRSFPGLQHLSMSKQQELYDKAMEHFDDLKLTLRKVEQIDREVRLDDVRSTVWVVKAAVYCLFAILVLAFFMDISRGLADSVYIVVDDAFGSLTNWFFDSLGI